MGWAKPNINISASIEQSSCLNVGGEIDTRKYTYLEAAKEQKEKVLELAGFFQKNVCVKRYFTN